MDRNPKIKKVYEQNLSIKTKKTYGFKSFYTSFWNFSSEFLVFVCMFCSCGYKTDCD